MSRVNKHIALQYSPTNLHRSLVIRRGFLYLKFIYKLEASGLSRAPMAFKTFGHACTS